MIVKLVLENFKRYRGRHEIEFKEGLNLIQGHNDAGKTTLFHAISYAFFNQTPSLGTTTYPLVTMGESRMKVSVEFLNPKTNELYRLTRYREASKRSSSGFRLEKLVPGVGWMTLLSSEAGAREKDLRSKLIEILGLDKKTFFNVIYAEQKEFVRLIRGGNEIRKIFDSILGLSAIGVTKKCIQELLREIKLRLERFSDMESRIKELEELRDNFSTEAKMLAEEIVKLERKYSALSNDLRLLETKREEISKLKDMLNKISLLRLNREKLKARLSQMKKEYDQIISSWGSTTKLKLEIENLKDQLSRISSQIESLKSKLSSIDSEKANILRRLGYLEDTLSIRLEVSKRSKCPTCGQPIDPKHIKEEVSRLELERSRLKEQLKAIENEHSSIEKTMEELRIKRDRIVANLSQLEKSLQDALRYSQDITNLETEIRELERRLREDTQVIMTRIGKYLNESQVKKLESLSLTGALELLEVMINNLDNSCWKEYSRLKAEREGIGARIKALLSQRKSVLDKVRDLEDRLNRYKEELKEAPKYKQALIDLSKIKECYDKLESELRKHILNAIASKTYYWYRQLVSDPLYVRVEIDPETYELKAQPYGFPEPQSVRAFSGGGHETIFALALRLALAEITGFNNFLMLDEPTDATDSANRDAIIEALYKASHRFKQILLITHHGVGRELSAYTLHIRFDKAKNSSLVEVLIP